MTLGTLIIMFAVAGAILTALIGMSKAGKINWLVSFLQNFTGTWFIFSGAVKAIDPMGTAFKMEQYFAEFVRAFEGTWFSFLAPLFPKLSAASSTFAVAMITLEIVVGLALILGGRNKLTSWVFLITLVFFTFLTGFTYLTGYVPDGVNFFQFAKWGPYIETNMKVTDCGCFGDFIKLKPKTSFIKDLFLLIPAFIFVFRSKDMHSLWTPAARTAVLSLTTVATVLFCISNYVWNEPVVDFRPFKEGVNIREQKQKEEEAANNVELIAYRLKNNKSGEVVELPFEQYLKEFKNYPKEEWTAEQIKSEPAIARTKISDFDVQDVEGTNMTEQLLSYDGYMFMIVAYKLYGKDAGKETISVPDTIWGADTVRVGDAVQVNRKVLSIANKQVEKGTYAWDGDYVARWTKVVNPMLETAEKDGVNALAITAFEDPGKIDDFRHATQSAYNFFTADDIMIKTIMRSNPGVILMKNGEIIQKWHYKQLPSYEEIKAKYMK
ncbi:MAG: hypothetical protein ACK4TA_14535 [Saprospiraceae bacterium]